MYTNEQLPQDFQDIIELLQHSKQSFQKEEEEESFTLCVLLLTFSYSHSVVILYF